MREADTRGRRLAIVSHALMNAHLSVDEDAISAMSLLEDLGYGLMALPPTTQRVKAQNAALDDLMDQLQDYLRHGYSAIAVESDPDVSQLERLDLACDAAGVARPSRVKLGSDFRASLKATKGE